MTTSDYKEFWATSEKKIAIRKHSIARKDLFTSAPTAADVQSVEPCAAMAAVVHGVKSVDA